jgi:hypothetical protein
VVVAVRKALQGGECETVQWVPPSLKRDGEWIQNLCDLLLRLYLRRETLTRTVYVLLWTMDHHPRTGEHEMEAGRVWLVARAWQVQNLPLSARSMQWVEGMKVFLLYRMIRCEIDESSVSITHS